MSIGNKVTTAKYDGKFPLSDRWTRVATLKSTVLRSFLTD